jgi:hypothetical protein
MKLRGFIYRKTTSFRNDLRILPAFLILTWLGISAPAQTTLNFEDFGAAGDAVQICARTVNNLDGGNSPVSTNRGHNAAKTR